MKTIRRVLAIGFVFVSTCVGSYTVGVVAAEPLLRPNDRLAIVGDATSANLSYGFYFESCLLMAQPVEGLDVARFDWGARLDPDVVSFRPTVVLINFNSGDVKTREDTLTAWVRSLKGVGVRTIVVGSPRCVDSFYYHKDPEQAAAYNKTLAALAEIDKRVAAKESVIYADVYESTLAAMLKAKAQNGEQYPFGNEDGCGPSEGCSLTIACAFLKAFGCTEDIGAITVDFAAQKAEGSPGQMTVRLTAARRR